MKKQGHDMANFNDIGDYLRYLAQVGAAYGKPRIKLSSDGTATVHGAAQRFINIQEEELEHFSVKVAKGDILVVPEGKLNLIPERFRSTTIELPNSSGYSVIKGR